MSQLHHNITYKNHDLYWYKHTIVLQYKPWFSYKRRIRHPTMPIKHSGIIKTIPSEHFTEEFLNKLATHLFPAAVFIMNTVVRLNTPADNSWALTVQFIWQWCSVLFVVFNSWGFYNDCISIRLSSPYLAAFSINIIQQTYTQIVSWHKPGSDV